MKNKNISVLYVLKKALIKNMLLKKWKQTILSLGVKVDILYQKIVRCFVKIVIEQNQIYRKMQVEIYLLFLYLKYTTIYSILENMATTI